MNTTVLIVLSLPIYYLTYKFYGRHLEKKVVKAEERETPAKRLYDGVDFIPANKNVLFGHHFASIAGAAPIIGPAIAIAWGWLPGLLWIWFGNIFIGAVHDYLSLMSSVRYDGHSVQWIAGRVIKKRTGYLFALFIFFVLILVVAAFGSVIAAFIGIALAWTGAWTIIWPAFGGANQMLASIALMTGAAWVIREQKTVGWNVLSPALFLWVTVTLAMVWFVIVAVPTFMDKNPIQAYFLGSISVIMLFLNFLLIYDFLKPGERKAAIINTYKQ